MIKGYYGVNVLEGKGGDDVMEGFSFDDILDGGKGNDELFSFKYNICRFSTPLDAQNNVDFIYGPPWIELSQEIFTNLPVGDLEDKYFVEGRAATTGDHHLIFDPYSNKLYYDADGVGGDAQVVFARLPDASSLLGAGDISVY